jgi:hypothetical protein
VEFAWNNSIHHSTLITPFWANYNYYSTMQFKPPRTAVSDYRCRQRCGWQAWKRLTKFSGKT